MERAPLQIRKATFPLLSLLFLPFVYSQLRRHWDGYDDLLDLGKGNEEKDISFSLPSFLFLLLLLLYCQIIMEE